MQSEAQSEEVQRAIWLRSLTDAEFSRAKTLYRYVTVIYVAGLLVAAPALFVPSRTVAFFLALVALLLQTAAWMVRHAGQRSHSYAQQLDWRTLLMDALGETEEDALDASRLAAGMRGRLPDDSGSFATYHASKAQRGLTRLREHLAETAFFTELLYRECARQAFRRFWFLTTAIVATGLSALVVLAARNGADAGRLFLLVLGFLPAWDAYGRAASWSWAAERLARAGIRLETPASLPRAFALFGDVVVACGMAPTIPESIYAKYRDHLNMLWRRKRSSPQAIVSDSMVDASATSDTRQRAASAAANGQTSQPTVASASSQRATLVAAADEARGRAYAPYSDFRVGAAVRCEDGAIVTGANVENASFPLSVCAEVAAVTRALAEGHTKVVEIAIAGDASSLPPCGACRQVLSEFAPGETKVTYPEGGESRTKTLAELLPGRFSLPRRHLSA